MLRRLRWLIDLTQRNSSVKRLTDAEFKPLRPAMLDTQHEIAIYIHRFHNLDLFQQGWYQIRISLRWEDDSYTSVGIPSRVVQYEATPNLGSGDSYGVWRIDDTDNSFSTQPFKIKYARQDVPLSILISFNLSIPSHEVPSKCGVIIKFELMYASLLEKGVELQASLNAAAATHEFWIPPKGLLGLHSYCPVHFDAFHAALVDTSVHISLLKSVASRSPKKVSSYRNVENLAGDIPDKPSLGTSEVEKEIKLVKALLTARDILLEETQNLSKAINEAINVADFISQLDDTELFGSSSQTDDALTNTNSQQEQPDSQNIPEKVNVLLDFRSNGVLQTLSKDTQLRSAHILGEQIHYLWNIFLKFHRANKTKVVEFLQQSWAKERRTEWSIWMTHSKVEMPHHFINSRGDVGSLNGALRGKISVLRRLSDDPAQTSATRAELHRRSIAQMRINNCSIHDLEMFGDPSHVPVVFVEGVINSPRCSFNGNSYLAHADERASSTLVTEHKTASKGRVLKVVVFVHGFQGHHLDLRLVRNQWLLIDPKVEFLMSEANEDKTSGDVGVMGNRLAKEVVSFLKKKMDKVSRCGGLTSIKLSFVGHSIGNVIIRAALTESIMEPYLMFLHTYVSVSGPHLGYLYSSNSLFNSGLWLLKKLKSTQCIHQLTLTDDADLENTFFFKLCQQKTLEYFKNIILLSSPQDGYVPYHSARMELCPAASNDLSKKGKVLLQMLNNCLDQIRSPTLEHRVFMRCDVNFNMSSHGKNLNTLIGRAAHIEFLETDIFAKLVMWSFPELFR